MHILVTHIFIQPLTQVDICKLNGVYASLTHTTVKYIHTPTRSNKKKQNRKQSHASELVWINKLLKMETHLFHEMNDYKLLQ